MKGVFKKVRDERLGDILVPVGIPAQEALRAAKYGSLSLDTLRDGREILAGIKEGKLAIVDIKGARNPLQLNLFWALIGILVKNSPNQFPNKDIAKSALCRELGYVHIWMDPIGRMQIIDKSIATESMEQAEFNLFFKAAADKICEHLNTAPQDVIDEVHKMLEGQWEQAGDPGWTPPDEEAHDPETGELPPQATEKPTETPSAGPEGNTGVAPEPPAGGPPPPPPEDMEPAPTGPAEPTTDAEYAEWLIAWLERYDNEPDIEARWLAELELRNRCGVHQDRWTHCKALVNNRVRKVRRT